MPPKTYRAAVIGLGMIGGADQISGDVLGQRVDSMDGTHTFAYQNHPRIDLVAGASRDQGRASAMKRARVLNLMRVGVKMTNEALDLSA